MENKLANPAPLGLFGFGMTTILLNLHNMGLIPLTNMILAMGIFYGGLAQVIAGICEFKKGNTFGMIAFTSYGMFWLTLVFIVIAGKGGLFPTDEPSLSAYLALWGVFTVVFAFGTSNGNTVGKLIFWSLALLFFLLALGKYTESAAIIHFAGIEGVICGSFAFYEGAAIVLNEKLGREVLPLG